MQGLYNTLPAPAAETSAPNTPSLSTHAALSTHVPSRNLAKQFVEEHEKVQAVTQLAISLSTETVEVTTLAKEKANADAEVERLAGELRSKEEEKSKLLSSGSGEKDLDQAYYANIGKLEAEMGGLKSKLSSAEKAQSECVKKLSHLCGPLSTLGTLAEMLVEFKSGRLQGVSQGGSRESAQKKRKQSLPDAQGPAAQQINQLISGFAQQLVSIIQSKGE